MSRTFTSLSNTSTFEEWIAATNNVIDAFTQTITVGANSGGDLTTGNAYVNGIFGAVNLVTSTLSGGNVSSSSYLTIISNTVFNAIVNVAANTIVYANNIILGANATSNIFSITTNSSGSFLSVIGANVVIGSNLYVTGSILSIPSGNSTNRPTGANGFIRYNSETSILEVYANSSWQNVVIGVITANTIPFTPNGSISANTVEDAIIETYTEKVSLTGDTMSGPLVVNLNGTNLPTSLTGYVLQLGQTNGVKPIVELDSFASATSFSGRRSDGTNASKSTLANNDEITVLDAYGYNGSAYTTERARIVLGAAEVWNTNNNGTFINFETTLVGSNTKTVALSLTTNNALVNTKNFTVNGNSFFNGNLVFNSNLTVNLQNIIVSGGYIKVGNTSTSLYLSQNGISSDGVTFNSLYSNSNLSFGNGLLLSGINVTVVGGNGTSVTANGVNAVGANGINVGSGGIYAVGSNGISVTSTGINAKSANGISVTSAGINAVGANGINVTSDGINVTVGNGISANSTGIWAVASNGVSVTASGINVVANNGIISNTSGIWAKGANGISVTSTGINAVVGNGLSANSTGIWAVGANGISVTSSGINAVVGNGLSANSTGIWAVGANGVTVTAAGINVQTGNGLTANSTGVWAVSSNGITITASGINAVGANGINVTAAGINAKAANGIAVDSSGINATGANGISVTSSGINVVGANGISVTSGGVAVVANTGIVSNTSGIWAVPPWTSITGTPTTISGYGITDSIAYYNSTGLFTKSQAVSVVSLGTSGTITPDFSQSNFFSTTLTANATLANPSNLVAGQTGSIHIQQDATGSRTLSYGTSWKFTGGVTPTLSTGANKVDRLDYFVANSTFIHAAISNLIGG